jgi:hypothetical protein
MIIIGTAPSPTDVLVALVSFKVMIGYFRVPRQIKEQVVSTYL